MDNSLISEKKLSELLEIFKEDREGNKTVTVLDLFKYVLHISRSLTYSKIIKLR